MQVTPAGIEISRKSAQRKVSEPRTVILSWNEAWDLATAAVWHYAQQDVSELAQALIEASAIGPKTILEIGSADGGSVYAWRGIAAHVLAITVDDPEYSVDPHGAKVGMFDSHTEEARAWLAEQLDGDVIDVLFIDGDHSAAGVAADYADYAPFVRPGGLVFIHDVANAREPGVVAFWNALDEKDHVIRNDSQVWGPAGIGVVVKGALKSPGASPG